MLRLILGKAGTGKTSAVMDEIRAAVEAKQGGRILIVPEQYSHEAERELCQRCGDTMSLYAEVFSFTGLARRIISQQGGGAAPLLDKGGRLLCMALAVKNAGAKLRVYSAAGRKAEIQSMLLSAVDELKSACITADMLTEAAAGWDDSLSDKLRDMALILEAYDAVTANGKTDPSDRLTKLASQIEESGYGRGLHIYADGFTDFTAQEQSVLAALMRNGAEVCVCLTADSLSGDNEIFELSRRAGRSLLRQAEELGVETNVQVLDAPPHKDAALSFFAENMFSWSEDSYGKDTDAIELWRCESMAAECELAAAKALELVRTKGCRWRDIAVNIRGFEDYRGTLESVFGYYGVPLFTARRSDLLSRPLPALISAAYDITLGGWEVDDLLSYMRTGLVGLSSEECDELGGYIFKWQLRAPAWLRKTPWRQHPDGYGQEYDDAARERLRNINALRRRIAAPLQHFAEAAAEAETAIAQARALSGLLEELKLPELLSHRAETLRQNGREELAAEYEQLWDITVSALEQCAAILGDIAMDQREFGRLFLRMLSQYDVGTIPVSLDRVSAGDFDRSRRRHIKHLIVLGASDQRLPSGEESVGVFSEDDRRRLAENGLDLGGGGEAELWREFSLIYNCLTLPGESLTLCCPLCGADGGEIRPAFVFRRAETLFRLNVKFADTGELRMSAADPALSLAARSLHAPGGREHAAMEYFREVQPEKCRALEQAAAMDRGSLSGESVERLYSKRLRLSASRIDKFASCRFAYFCQYGLKAKPYEPAGFQPPEIGSFMHYVLENTAREVKALGGFRKVSDAELKEITEKYVRLYVSEELDDFREKSSRFIHLFKRLCADVHQVVADMAAELRTSDFEPMDFELDFSGAGDIEPFALDENGEKLTLTGIADRVDGWLHDGKLYLRVVDYKTGKKQFSLSDVWYGMGLQMLLYLFALESGGRERYGREIVPAGVMYVPARNTILSLTDDPTDEKISSERARELRRSGIVLDEEAVIEAWEHGEDKRYIPLRTVYGKISPETVASAERLGVLRRHIRKELSDMARQLRSGSIAADPYYRSQQENACLNCDYFAACHFTDGQNGDKARFMPRLSPEKVWSLMEGGGENE